jgi:hypothetical protein
VGVTHQDRAEPVVGVAVRLRVALLLSSVVTPTRLQLARVGQPVRTRTGTVVSEGIPHSLVLAVPPSLLRAVKVASVV